MRRGSFFAILMIPICAVTFANEISRKVETTSCRGVKIFLGLGMTTQLVFEQPPKMTLFADKTHFKITTNEISSRSLAIIPVIKPAELEAFASSNGAMPSAKALAQALDRTYQTNLFVFFGQNNQLMFELGFVEKEKADRIVQVNQTFTEECSL